MRRYACVFLPYWPIERSAARPDASAARPIVVVASASGGWRIAAADRRAQALGVAPGELLADVRARIGALDVREAGPEADRQALEKLARWAACFSPYVAPWEHGLTFDIEGCAHLFGGEARMARHMRERLSRFGLTARIAIASTIGAAHALCRFGPEIVVPTGKEEEALACLPVTALRISEKQAASLVRLGLKRIGDVARLPRAPLAQRFGADFVERLDQALGRLPEPFSPLAAPIAYRAIATLAEPITVQEHVLDLTRRLACDLMPALNRDGKGARLLRLTLYRVDGETRDLTVGLAAASRDAAHIVNLFALKLDALAEDYDAGFGFEAARLDALECETMPAAQESLTAPKHEDTLSLLIDRLGSRLGLENVVRLKPEDTHIPERAVVYSAAEPDWSGESDVPRPLLMLPCAEPAEVTALMPEGPPKRFRWRGVSYGVAHAEGPERIRPEWWRKQPRPRSRDYYTVEDEAGRRFWLYRELMAEGDVHPRWYMHGVFA
jgi:protein ImuB